MPHLHMLLFMEKDWQIDNPETIDEYVSARIPALPEMHDFSPEANQQRRLWHYVTSYMLHDCNQACAKTITKANGKEEEVCKKYFPKSFNDQTEISGFLILIILCLHFL